MADRDRFPLTKVLLPTWAPKPPTAHKEVTSPPPLEKALLDNAATEQGGGCGNTKVTLQPLCRAGKCEKGTGKQPKSSRRNNALFGLRRAFERNRNLSELAQEQGGKKEFSLLRSVFLLCAFSTVYSSFCVISFAHLTMNC